MFATEEEKRAALTKPIMYNNFRVYWIREEKEEIRRKEYKGKDKVDTYEHNQDLERYNYDNKREQRDETNVKEEENKESINTEDRRRIRIKKNYETQAQKAESWTKDRALDNKKEENSNLEEVKTHIKTQGKGSYVEDILGRILERLERLESAKETAWENYANRS